MATLNAWSTTDANNNATPPDGWPEGTMKYSEVNDAGRAVQGTVRRFFGDINGSLDLAYDNPTNTYSVALNEVGYTTIFRGLTFRGLVATANASASPSITVNSTISATLKRLDGSTIAAGDLQPGMYLFVCDGTAFRVGGKFPETVKSPEANSLVAGGGAAITTGTKNTFFGIGAGDAVTTGSTNVIMGDGAASGVTTGYDNVVIGSGAGSKMNYSNTVIGARAFSGVAQDGTEIRNVFIGQEAGYLALAGAGRNVAVGYRAGANIGYFSNTAIGYIAGFGINQTDGNNIAIGAYSLNKTTSFTKSNNVIVGDYAGYNLADDGVAAGSSQNVFMGYNAGYNANGASIGNVIIGTNAGPASLSTITNLLFINNHATSNPLVGGRFSTATVGGLFSVNTVNGATVNDFEIDGEVLAGESPIAIRDGASLKKVSFGVADSGGTGYKVLRVAN